MVFTPAHLIARRESRRIRHWRLRVSLRTKLAAHTHPFDTIFSPAHYLIAQWWKRWFISWTVVELSSDEEATSPITKVDKWS